MISELSLDREMVICQLREQRKSGHSKRKEQSRQKRWDKRLWSIQISIEKYYRRTIDNEGYRIPFEEFLNGFQKYNYQKVIKIQKSVLISKQIFSYDFFTVTLPQMNWIIMLGYDILNVSVVNFICLTILRVMINYSFFLS